MKRYLNVIKFWAKKLIVVEVCICINKADMGKIIGKNGNIITNLRNLVNSISKKDKKNVKIVVKDM